MEELLAKHRKEKRDLQAKVTQKKKAATKKTRKGVNDECDRLEAELKAKQEAEIAALGGDGAPAAEDKNKVVEEESPSEESIPQDTSVSDLKVDDLSLSNESAGPKKPSRQKARLARRAAEQARAAEEASAEAESMPDLRAREKEIMSATFDKHGLVEKEIRADGHCLYSALADQITLGGDTLPKGSIAAQKDDYRTVRHVAADYIEQHEEDFVPFMEEDMNEYLRKVRDTGEWGGQLELMALAKAYGVKIHVVQGDGMVTEIGDDGDDVKKVWLAYYRHGFGLGEHYNSLRQASKT